ncbi:MAG: Unknown protein [uncultured Sulfurovum sp.]|uniref:Hemerythrin-like domain-containing protein n=1 Tax=uncultured Sulfurovum sp. TaxID=269237 RepID=A0A6S6TI96_9BACT|nr:MAG: Unknown protein [uncultured Sulfurovum sp.]
MLISHEEIPQVSQNFMNDTHKEDVDIINTIFEAILTFEKENKDPETIDTLYKEWIAHTIDHFTTEEVEMIESEFHAFPMHKGEHDRVLAQMNEVFEAWQKSRDIQVLKVYFIEVIPQWLNSHISTMDAVTANHIGGGMMPAYGHM